MIGNLVWNQLANSIMKLSDATLPVKEIPKCSLGTDLMICDSYCTVQLFRWLTEFQVNGG